MFFLAVLLVFTGCEKQAQTTSLKNSDPITEQPKVQITPAVKAEPDANIMAIISYVSDKNNAKKFISREEFPGDGVRVVFDHKKHRYTIFYSGKSGDEFISYWVRPSGTKDQVSVVTFSAGIDGVVNFGMTGEGDKKDRSITTEKNKHFADMKAPDYQAGLEYREFWQKQFDEALTHSLTYFGKTKLLTAKDL